MSALQCLYAIPGFSGSFSILNSTVSIHCNSSLQQQHIRHTWILPTATDMAESPRTNAWSGIPSLRLVRVTSMRSRELERNSSTWREGERGGKQGRDCGLRRAAGLGFIASGWRIRHVRFVRVRSVEGLYSWRRSTEQEKAGKCRRFGCLGDCRVPMNDTTLIQGHYSALRVLSQNSSAIGGTTSLHYRHWGRRIVSYRVGIPG